MGTEIKKKNEIQTETVRLRGSSSKKSPWICDLKISDVFWNWTSLFNAFDFLKFSVLVVLHLKWSEQKVKPRRRQGRTMEDLKASCTGTVNPRWALQRQMWGSADEGERGMTMSGGEEAALRVIQSTRSGRGPLSGVLFTHHKPVYYIDIQATQSSTVLGPPRPPSVCSQRRHADGMIFRYDIPKPTTACRISLFFFWSEIVWKHSLPIKNNDTKGQERGGAKRSGGGVYNPIGD